MLQIDFSKAFDSISFKFIENTLKFFGLSPKYIHWINSLLKNFQSSKYNPKRNMPYLATPQTPQTSAREPKSPVKLNPSDYQEST